MHPSTDQNPKIPPEPGDSPERHTNGHTPDWGDYPTLDAYAEDLPFQDISEFLADFTPPNWLVDDLLQTGFLYTLTGATGHGKTAISTTLQLAIATGRPFGHLKTRQRRVLVLCGENPTDYQMRLFATAQEMEIGQSELRNKITVLPRAFALPEYIATLLARIAALEAINGPYGAIFIDTSAAYYGGDNDNDNAQMHAHAQTARMLTASGATVVMLCHPIKAANPENLLPRGGGALLNAVDGNLTVWRTGTESSTLHWAGKIRGPDFQPVMFELRPTPLADHHDAEGRQIGSIFAKPISDREASQMQRDHRTDEDQLLEAMLRHPKVSMGDYADSCGWHTGPKNLPYKTKVARILVGLAAEGLAKKYRGDWILTDKGKSEAERLADK